MHKPQHTGLSRWELGVCQRGEPTGVEDPQIILIGRCHAEEFNLANLFFLEPVLKLICLCSIASELGSRRELQPEVKWGRGRPAWGCVILTTVLLNGWSVHACDA